MHSIILCLTQCQVLQMANPWNSFLEPNATHNHDILSRHSRITHNIRGEINVNDKRNAKISKATREANAQAILENKEFQAKAKPYHVLICYQIG
jgi:hypothetical protein